MSIAGLERCSFTYYPEISGIATGYSAFTDYHAMRSDLNNWLLKEVDAMQYWLVGFGLGFVQAVLQRSDERGSRDLEHRVMIESSDSKIIESVRWLQRLQRSGVDNSPPSTLNLYGSLEEFCGRLANDGPIRKDYWIKGEGGDTPIFADSKEFREGKISEAKRCGCSVRFV
jgi:hypothetical protein